MSGKDRPRTTQAEHARLRKALRESEILRELADILNSSLDLEHILQELVKRTTELCEVARCAIWLLDDGGERLRPANYYLATSALSSKQLKAADTIWHRSYLLMNNPIIERLLNEGGMLLLEDLRSEPTVRTFAETFQVRSALLIALLRDGRPVGLMSLDNPDQSRPFSQEQQQLARAIAQQATIAIHNARLYQQAQEQRQRADHLIERARAVYEVAMRVNSGEELSAILKLATEHLARALNAVACFTMMLDADATRLQALGPLAEETQAHFAAIGLHLDDLPNFWLAIHTGKSLLVTAELARDQEIEWFRRFGLRYLLLVPLTGSSPRLGGNWDLSASPQTLAGQDEEKAREIYCPGLMVIHYTRRRKPSAGEYAFAQDIAAQCALALEKARLLAEAREAAELATERASTLDAVFQSMNEGIAVITSEGQISLRNHAVARFLGRPVYDSLPLEQFIQEHPAYTLDGQPIAFDDFPLVRALRGQTQVRGERCLTTRADGTPRVVELNATPLRDREMRPVGLVCALRDVTVQTQAEQRVRQALETFLHIAEAVSHSLEIREILQSVLAETLKTLRCARGTVHLFQQSFEPLLSLGFTQEEETRWLSRQELWLQPQTGQVYGFFAQVMNGHAVVVSEEHCPVHPNPFTGTLVLAAPIKHNQRILGLLLLDRSPLEPDQAPQRPASFTTWDLTIIEGIAQLAGAALEQARWQQEASDARASEAIMREADAMKNEFLAITAHEFRNPLTVILARSQSARRLLQRSEGKEMNPSIEEHLNIITAQSKQLSNIVTTFLDAARINQGQLHLKQERIDLEQVARQVIDEQAALAEHHTLRYLSDENAPAYLVMGDQARLHQVLANLVENAVKYSPPGGSVSIRLRHCLEAGTIEVSVSDTGLGIPADAQSRLFERFYRVPQMTESEARGVGLGLYIVAHLVKMHGSQIQVESSGIPGEGSRFHFTLPALAQTPDDTPVGA
ncbi:MAG TPA: GAF domain-containing protein [Ktedonobacteraceae bacterium]|nr:GAF domain-containing protein [Ktedonobacteraceae bacterium]